MVRMKPQEPLNQTYGGRFDAMCAAARNHWQLNTLDRTSGPVLYVDMLSQDIRVAIRNLTLAAAMQRHVPCRMVALVGPDAYWADMIWSYYDQEHMEQVAQAYGAVDVIDLGMLVDEVLEGREVFSMLDEPVQVERERRADPQRYAEITEATHLRALRIPVLTDEVRASEEYLELERRNDAYARVWDALMTRPSVGFVTSHIDYHQWGFGVDAAMRAEVPVFHVQSTGSFKAYALFPEHTDLSLTARENWTLQIADYFERHIWSARDVLERAAEVVAFRSKSNYGRPSWWRGGGSISELGFHSEQERQSVREHAMRLMGFDPEKPVIVVFNHAVSDAVHSNHEIFDNLADWFEQTVEYATQHPEVNWLIVDHPAQANYDGTEHFEAIAERHADVAHVAFEQSLNLSKNVLWSLIDLAVTVRGSVSNEFPAYGIPALQAGWSEWSHIGFSRRADSREEYWAALEESITKLRAGERMITDEQVARARLWLWFYRAGTDVDSGYVPHWESSQGDRLYLAIILAFTHVESDGDAGLVAVRRMLKQREPFLTRIDLAVPHRELADTTAAVGAVRDVLPDEGPAEAEGPKERTAKGLSTIFDEIAPAKEVPASFDSGADESLVIYDGLIRGVKVLGRGNRSEVLLGLKVEPSDDELEVELALTLDNASHSWWAKKFEEDPAEVSRQPRHLVVRCGGDVVGACTMGGERNRTVLRFTVPPHSWQPGGLLLVHLGAADLAFAPEVNERAMFGIQIDRVDVRPVTAPLESVAHAVDSVAGGTAQGSVFVGPDPVTVRYRIVEKPRIASVARQHRSLRPAGRLARKSGVVGRSLLRRGTAVLTDRHGMFAVRGVRADGSAVRVHWTTLAGDVLQLEFPAVDEGRKVVFFEVEPLREGLTKAHFCERVQLVRQ